MYCLEGMKSVIWYILISVHFVLKNEFQKEVIKKINDKKNPKHAIAHCSSIKWLCSLVQAH